MKSDTSKALKSAKKAKLAYIGVIVVVVAATAIITVIVINKFEAKKNPKSLNNEQMENVEKIGEGIKSYYENKYK